jgi:inorganic triphosphatase YgiF
MPEVELKFLMDERTTRQVRSRLRDLELQSGRPRTRTLRSVYYDTDDHALKAAGVGLRLRRFGRRWVQTVKARRRLHGGLLRVEEVECPAPGGRLDPAAIPDPAIRAEVLRLIDGRDLHPVCETVIRRTSSELGLSDGTRAELALDVGEITANQNAAPFREAEVELIEGNVGALYDLARDLFPRGGFRFSHLSKSDRGYLLARDGVIDAATRPRRARAVLLEPGLTSEQAAQEVLRECFDQIAMNCDVVARSDDPEGPHQLRVGLRRLRSALAAFGPAIGSPAAGRLAAEARWLGQEIGRLRDLDVAIGDIVAPEAAARPHEPGFAALGAALAERAEATRSDVRRLLASPRLQDFLIDLARFVEARGWLIPDDIDQSRRLAVPVTDLAQGALGKRWKAASRRARGIAHLDIEARHDLRKELKKLRYAVEFMAPLHPAKKVRPFVRRLKDLQAVFGDLNDAAMAEALLLGAGAPAADDPAAQRATGWIIGARLARAEHGWAEARSLWRELTALGPFWR